MKRRSQLETMLPCEPMSIRSPIGYRRVVLTAIILLVLALVALPLDSRIANAFRAGLLPGDLRALVTLAEVFAHGLGVTAILIVVWSIMIEHRRKIVRVAACAFAPGIAVSLAKTLIARDRPSSLKAIPENFTETFHGVLPAFTQGDLGLLVQRNLQSFPSGHSATAIGLAIGLSWLVPRGRWCFAAFAILAMCQRMQSGAHFPSDTLFAAAIATLIAGYFVANTRLSERFARFERIESKNFKLKTPDENRMAA